MSNKRVVILIGESGSGKSAIKKAIMKMRPDYHEVVTSTTRPIREGEKNGVDYFYYSDAEMAEKIYAGEMAEAVGFRDWIYGTEYKQLEDGVINVGVWNPEGAETLANDTALDGLVIYIYASPKVRLMRSLTREENPDVDEICRRYGTDKEDFNFVDVPFMLQVNNDGSRPVEEVAAEVISKIDRHLGKF